MHQHIRKTGVFVKNRLSNTLKSYNGFDFLPSKRAPGFGFAPYSSGNGAIGASSKREGLRSGKALALGNYLAKPVGTLPLRESGSRSIFMCSRSLLQPTRSEINSSQVSFAARAFTSKASESTNQSKSETRKELSAFEDPFDAPTNVIPEKPMSFTEGASYSLIILAGLGIAGAAAYAVFKELIFQPKEYTVFNKALKRIQDNGQVRVRIGSPITGYGSVSRNRAARQRLPHKIWVDQDGVDHVEVNFYIRGPHGAGKVFTEMFKDKEDGEWKFMYLIVELTAPNQQQLILESYIPA